MKCHKLCLKFGWIQYMIKSAMKCIARKYHKVYARKYEIYARKYEVNARKYHEVYARK